MVIVMLSSTAAFELPSGLLPSLTDTVTEYLDLVSLSSASLVSSCPEDGTILKTPNPGRPTCKSRCRRDRGRTIAKSEKEVYKGKVGKRDGGVDMEAAESLFECLEQVPDPRRARGVRHPFQAILRLTLLGLVCGQTTMAHITLFARMNWPALKEPLGFLTIHPTPPPSRAPWRGSRMSGCRRP